MRLLLDTCTFLWLTVDNDRLTDEVQQLVADGANEVYLSSVSTWEIAVKHSLGALDLPAPPQVYIPRIRREHAIDEMPLDEESTFWVGRLPALHRDPFDRMLVCQAIAHGMVLLTPDPQVRQYPVRTLW